MKELNAVMGQKRRKEDVLLGGDNCQRVNEFSVIPDLQSPDGGSEVAILKKNDPVHKPDSLSYGKNNVQSNKPTFSDYFFLFVIGYCRNSV